MWGWNEGRGIAVAFALGIAIVAGLLEFAPGFCVGAEPSSAPRLDRFTYTESHMGSDFKIILYTVDEPAARRASRSAFDRIAALDAILSDYQPESELMRLCAQAGGPPIPVSAELFDVLERSQAISRKSGGAFDATVGPVVRLWRRARRDRKLPATDRLAEARALVGWEQVELDPKARTVRLAKPGMKLDLGGIAKGYASQAAIDELARLGVRKALVAGAGDIVAGDPPPDAPGTGWLIGIAPVEDPKGPPRQFLRVHNAAVSTAGDAERFVEIAGKRYSHIVDPRTGLGVVDRCSVTVVAPDGATADSLDTAAYVLGPERGLALIESTPGAAALVNRLVAGKVETHQSRGIAAFLTLSQDGPAPQPAATIEP